MRLGKNVEAGSEKAVTIKTNTDIKRNRKIIWPDLMFGPVNLWVLPPADFFYRRLDRKLD